MPTNCLPVCACGEVCKYAGIHLCEDCAVENFIRYPGDDQSVNTLIDQYQSITD